jgi:pyroglutamyl-peptidase
MRILLYGFGPYKQFRHNISAKIVKALPRQPGLIRLVFPVRFHGRQFVKALTKYRPDIVLGLGQSSRNRIDIESRARNRRRAGKEVRPRAIRKNGPSWLGTTLKLKLERQARRSRNAGDYVCNYSMYVALHYIKRNRLRTKFGFVHIPHDYDPREARRYVIAVLKKLTHAD